MTTVSVTDLTNAKTDVDHIAAIATSTALTATDRLGTTKKTLQGAINSISAITDRGAWVTATAYAVKDVVLDTGVYYICITAHTSGGTFAGDSAKWRVYQGDLGAYHSVDVVNDIRGNDFSNRKMIRIATERGNPVYYLDSSDTVSADDDFLVVHDSASNRWKLVHDGVIDVRWAGAIGDGATDDTVAIQKAVDVTGSVDFGNRGSYRITAPIGLPTVLITDATTIDLVGSGATIKAESSEAIFTSMRSIATPDSTSDLYTSKINVRGLNFVGVGTSVIFNGDRLYNMYVTGCNFKSCTKVLYSYRNKGASYPNGYLQSVAFVKCHFTQNTKIIDAKVAFNLLLDGNFCENNTDGFYVDGAADPAVFNIRVVNNLFEGGGLFLKLGSVLGGTVSGNYLESNTLGDTVSLKCHIHMVRVSGGYTSGFVISNNSFGAATAQKTDTDWRDIKFAPGLVLTTSGVTPPVVFGNWSNSYQLFTENHVAISYGNGGPAGDVALGQRMRVPTAHEYAGVSFSRKSQNFQAATHLSAGVFTVAEISTADIKAILPINSASRAHTVELTMMVQNLTAGGVCVGSSAVKVVLIVQGAQSGGNVDTMFVAGSLVSFAQIQNGNVFDSTFSSDFKQHWTAPALSIVANGADNYYLKLSGYAAVATPNYGIASQIQTSIVMQVNASAYANTLRGLTTLP